MGKLLKIIKSETDLKQSLGPGNMKIANDVQIGTGKGILLPELLQFEGKKIVRADEFAKGNKHLDGVSVLNS